jgi:translation initiation factor 1
MARGKKLDLFIGADIEDGWAEVKNPSSKKSSSTILEPSKHQLHFKKEKRRGKVVTLVGEFSLSQQDATATLKILKKKIGCGGSYKNNYMEFQGELQEKIKDLLEKEGFRFAHKWR